MIWWVTVSIDLEGKSDCQVNPGMSVALIVKFVFACQEEAKTGATPSSRTR